MTTNDRTPGPLRVVDLFSGGGGASEGYSQAGFDVVMSLDNWAPARDTHHRNHPECDSRLGDVMKLTWKEIAEFEPDVLHGSPPCTQFSFANRGGRGDIEQGLELIHQFLHLVAMLELEAGLRWWTMENVPRVMNYVPERVPYAMLGVDRDGFLEIPQREIFVASDYGAPTKRRRFIAGRYPIPEPTHGENLARKRTLGDVVMALPDPAAGRPDGMERWLDPTTPELLEGSVVDLNDHFYDTRFSPEEVLENRRSKEDHSWYGRMAFPDPMDKPARTIMATFMRTSRETIIIEDPRRPGEFRHPTVREAACIQGFPASYQLQGSSLSQRYKVIGNAVPPPLTYAIGSAIKDQAIEVGAIRRNDMPELRKIEAAVTLTADVTHKHVDRPKRNFSVDRRFRDHVPGTKVSGFRVDLDNRGGPHGSFGWVARLYVGSGKTTASQVVDASTARSALVATEGASLMLSIDRVSEIVEAIEHELEVSLPTGAAVQAAHTGRTEGTTPLILLEELADLVDNVAEQFDINEVEPAVAPPDVLSVAARKLSIPVKELMALFATAITAEHLNRTTVEADLADAG